MILCTCAAIKVFSCISGICRVFHISRYDISQLSVLQLTNGDLLKDIHLTLIVRYLWVSEQLIKCAWTYQCTLRAPQQHLYRAFSVWALLSFLTNLFPRYSRVLISKQNVWFLLGFCWGLTIKQLIHSCFYCVHSFQQMCIASRFEISLVMYFYIAAFFVICSKQWTLMTCSKHGRGA